MTKPLDEFHGRKRQTYCKPCAKERRIERPRDPVEQALTYRKCALKRKYGITLDEYERMLEAQGGVCAICGQPETKRRLGQLLSLAVDHCHDTGAARGLLCHDCNTGIGKFRDRRELLMRAVDYLLEHA